MLKRWVVFTLLVHAALLFITQVVIPHARHSRPHDELRLLGLRRGREVIWRAVQAHGGLDAWENKVDARFRLIDKWNPPAGTALARLLDMWPRFSIKSFIQGKSGQVETVQHYLLRRNAGRIEMTTPRGHHVWGYFDFRPWAWLNGEIDEENIERANFTIPAVNYLFELPYKFLDTGVFPEFVSEVRIGERVYDRVRITFGLNVGRYPTDWYLADFDQETGRLIYLEYTIREKMPSYVRFSAAFTNHQHIDGLWMPTEVHFKMTSPLFCLALHNWQIAEVRFNTGVNENFFVPGDLMLTDAGLR